MGGHTAGYGELVMRAAPAHDCRSHAEIATAETAWPTADQSIGQRCTIAYLNFGGNNFGPGRALI